MTQESHQTAHLAQRGNYTTVNMHQCLCRLVPYCYQLWVVLSVVPITHLCTV